MSNLKLKQFNFGYRFDKQECQNSEKDNSDTSPVYQELIIKNNKDVALKAMWARNKNISDMYYVYFPYVSKIRYSIDDMHYI